MSKTCLAVIIALAVVFGILCFEAWIGMLLFNWVMSLFGCTFTLTFWQSFGVCVLLGFVGNYFKPRTNNN